MVVLTQLKIALLREGDDQWLCTQFGPFLCLPDLVVDSPLPLPVLSYSFFSSLIPSENYRYSVPLPPILLELGVPSPPPIFFPISSFSHLIKKLFIVTPSLCHIPLAHGNPTSSLPLSHCSIFVIVVFRTHLRTIFSAPHLTPISFGIKLKHSLNTRMCNFTFGWTHIKLNKQANTIDIKKIWWSTHFRIWLIIPSTISMPPLPPSHTRIRNWYRTGHHLRSYYSILTTNYTASTLCMHAHTHIYAYWTKHIHTTTTTPHTHSDMDVLMLWLH